MSRTASARARRRRSAAVALVVCAAATAGTVIALHSPTSQPSATTPAAGAVVTPEVMGPAPMADPDDDGTLSTGVTVFDDDAAAVTNLDPALLRALREAAEDAADEGVRFIVNSGWRSPEYQARLLQEAVAEYGSEAEAARWVATPETSAHVSGDAVDVGPDAATFWLSLHGARYGLCQIYLNEPWHYERRAEAVDGGCPRPYADPTQDPRMQP